MNNSFNDLKNNNLSSEIDIILQVKEEYIERKTSDKQPKSK